MTRLVPALNAAKRQGREAADNRMHFLDCPYSVKMMQRPEMEAWFQGWKERLDELGLGFNFKRKGDRYGKGV